MGVKGLTRFCRERQNYICEVYNISKIPHKSLKIIVDGNAYLYHLYSSFKLDWINGGDYDEFATRLRCELQIWEENKVHLFFVFDGLPEHKKRGLQVFSLF